MKKREFLKTASAASVIAFYGINLASCSSDDEPSGPGSGSMDDDLMFTLTTSGFTALATEGGWVNNTQRGLLLVNVGDDVIRAFTNVCTHQACSNNWTYSAPTFTCTCHNSKFNNAGQVTEGPATAALREFRVTKSGDTYTVSG